MLPPRAAREATAVPPGRPCGARGGRAVCVRRARGRFPRRRGSGTLARVSRGVRALVGLVLMAVGVWLVLSPLKVAEALHRPAETSSQMINLRASWGGSLFGLGAFVA